MKLDIDAINIVGYLLTIREIKYWEGTYKTIEFTLNYRLSPEEIAFIESYGYQTIIDRTANDDYENNPLNIFRITYQFTEQ